MKLWDFSGYRVFSLTRDHYLFFSTETKENVCMTQQSSFPGELVGDTNMAAVPLFEDANVAAVTSHENTLL